MGKSSINIQPAKAGSEKHNRREKKLSYVKNELSYKNESWEKDSIANILFQAKEIAKEKTGRKMQKKATPIREGVFLFEEHHTMDDAKRLADKIEARFGIKIFQIHMHRDEGHYDKITKEWKPNLHGHLLFDWTNHETGKSIKMNRLDMAELQTMVATELGMERGVASDKKHLNSQQFRIEAEIKHLQKKLAASNKALRELQIVKATLDKGEGELVAKKKVLGLLEVNDKDGTIKNIESMIVSNSEMKKKVEAAKHEVWNVQNTFKHRDKKAMESLNTMHEINARLKKELKTVLTALKNGETINPEYIKTKLGIRNNTPSQGKSL